MNMHKHARLTPAGRALLVQRLLAGEPRARVGAEMGLSPRSCTKWKRRFLEEGLPGLQDRSSRPKHSPRRLHRTRERQIIRLRQKRYAAPRIARLLQLPCSSVGCVLRRRGMGRLPPLQPAPPVVRYQRARAGELLHVDTKKLARIGTVGHRIHADRTTRVRGIGWEALHVAVDDATRLAYSEVLPDETKERCREFLLRACAWFERQGVRIEGVMTDNGSGYRSRLFRSSVAEVGARQLRTRPYTPRTNGKAERFIQSCLREWAYARAYPSSEERTRALASFQAYYNRERPHLGIQGRSPQQRLRELAVNNVLGNDN